MNKHVTVIGNVFMDIKGFAVDHYHPQAKNIGHIRFVQGGVGRNVAENLAVLGMPTRLVSTVDDSALGHEVVERLRLRNVDTRYLPSYPQGMGMWLATMDAEGNLVGSISQQPDFTKLHETLESDGHNIVKSSSHLALSIDLTEPIARKTIELAEMYRIPIYGLPGNMSVVMSHPELLSRLDCFVCNHVEAGRLMDLSFESLSLDEKVEVLVTFADSRSLRSIVITLGENGSVYYDRRSEVKGHQPVFPVRMVDSSGAGDAFFSGIVAGLTQGLPLDTAVIIGTRLAGWVIESPENNCSTAQELIKHDPYLKGLFDQ